ncbi:MAG TPA: tetratricopeptide repeat protein, partial [Longimicrobium sp.]|uniref:tetratricopeptide repeat protein n=1 Tax=Longimicrobium sp. TaxID=2029185 RepID=UPI002ED89FA8
MDRSQATVAELLALVPEMDEFELFRLRVIGAAVPDPGRTWDSSSAYATVDKRLVSPDDVERSIREAEESLRQYVTTLYDGLRPVFRAFYEGRGDEAAQRLIRLGEEMESLGRLKGARQCYRAALTLALPLQEKAAQILALRRIARATLALGDFQDAAQHYERTAQLARDAGDLRGEVVARTGLANVLVWQGGWTEAERRYRDALALAEAGGAELAQERLPLLYNLGMLATRMERHAEAEEWLGRALERAPHDGTAVDQANCFINLAQLR